MNQYFALNGGSVQILFAQENLLNHLSYPLKNLILTVLFRSTLVTIYNR